MLNRHDNLIAKSAASAWRGGTPRPASRTNDSSPIGAGIGLRAPHYRQVLSELPSIGWLEVHSENYFGIGGRNSSVSVSSELATPVGGAPLEYLEQARAHYPLSLHGVGLSLGSSDPLNRSHLDKLKALIARVEPALVSEHLCWSSIGGEYLNDLLPLPYTDEALRHVSARIREAQDYLGRRLLVENVSSYVQYRHSTIPESEFLAAVAADADCGILLDVNNIYVSATNHDFDAHSYIESIPSARVQEIHLAGHTVKEYPDGKILIDTHGSRVADDVWELYRAALAHCGPVPTLIEWDSDIPALEVLLDEAAKADALLDFHAKLG